MGQIYENRAEPASNFPCNILLKSNIIDQHEKQSADLSITFKLKMGSAAPPGASAALQTLLRQQRMSKAGFEAAAAEMSRSLPSRSSQDKPSIIESLSRVFGNVTAVGYKMLT